MIIFLAILISFLIMNYIIVISKASVDHITTKKELWLNCIPFYTVVSSVINFYKQLD